VNSAENRIASLESRMDIIEGSLREHLQKSATAQEQVLAKLQENTVLTQQVADGTSEIRALWKQGEAALSFFNFLMKWTKRAVALIALTLVGCVGIPYMVFHNGELPSWLKTLKEIVL
jgi:uncharacterized coiled-coil protein SlyX